VALFQKEKHNYIY
jgi:hypothetical protein